MSLAQLQPQLVLGFHYNQCTEYLPTVCIFTDKRYSIYQFTNLPTYCFYTPTIIRYLPFVAPTINHPPYSSQQIQWSEICSNGGNFTGNLESRFPGTLYVSQEMSLGNLVCNKKGYILEILENNFQKKPIQSSQT